MEQPQRPHGSKELNETSSCYSTMSVLSVSPSSQTSRTMWSMPKGIAIAEYPFATSPGAPLSEDYPG